MNQPQGFSPTTGDVTSVEPLKVIFNPAVPYEVPHMMLAAYLVTGFLVASIYAVGMLRGRRDRDPPARAADPADGRLHRRRRSSSRSATPPRARSPRTSRSSSRRWSACRRPPPHVTEYICGRCTPDGVKGGIGIPGLDSFLVGWSTRHAGDRARHRAARGPAAGQHDAALGVRRHGRDLHDADRASGCGSASSGGASATSRRSRWFLRAVAVSGVASIVALECGWIVTEVGRQPWIVYNVMRTEDAVTKADGIWVTFGADRRALRRRWAWR